MSETVDQFDVDMINENGMEDTINILVDSSDEEGYGVECQDSENIIASWTFGDSSIESFCLADKLAIYFDEVISKLAEQQAYNLKQKGAPFINVFVPSKLMDVSGVIQVGKKPTKDQTENVLAIIKILEGYFGEHPLTEKSVEETRENFGWPKETGLWSHLVQKSA